MKQTHDTGFTDPFGNAVRVTSNNPVNYNGGENGWYFELDITRERNIFRSVVRGGVVFFPTFVPNPDPCSSGGDSWLFSVDMVNGGSPSEAQTDVNLDGKIDGTDTVKKGGTEAYMSAKYKENTMAPSDVFTRSNRYSGGEGELVRELPNIPTGRFSWQELIQ